MSGNSDLVIRLMTDSGNAELGINRVTGALVNMDAAATKATSGGLSTLQTKLASIFGIGAASDVVVKLNNAAESMQTSMAKIATVYNAADFSQGSSKYQAVQDFIQQSSTQLATKFDDLATIFAQGSQITDQAGARLDTSKIEEYTTTLAELGKVSGDDADQLGSLLAAFEKVNNATDFAGVGSALSLLSSQHPQDLSTTLQAALGMSVVGAPLGVTEQQALGVGNFLSIFGGSGLGGVGGQAGGTALGRIMLNMTKAADTQLDPTAQYADVTKSRTAQERLDDLQTQLKEAEASRAHMYGQHGLKTQYRRDPEAVMASDDRIAKLQRDIADQQDNIAHLGDAKAGGLDIATMAATSGMDTTAYAQLFKDNPMDAILDFTQGLGNLPGNKVDSALAAAGFKNQRDLKLLSVLSTNTPEVRQMIDEAGGQRTNPTDLPSRAGIGLGTVGAKDLDVYNKSFNAQANAGQGVLQVHGAMDDFLLHLGSAGSAALGLAGAASSAVSGLAGLAEGPLSILIAQKLGIFGSGGAAGKVVSGASSTAAGSGEIATAVGGGGLLDATSAALAIIAPFVLADVWKDKYSKVGQVTSAGEAYAQHHPIGAALPDSAGPAQVNVGGVNVTVSGKGDLASIKDDIINEFAQQFTAAWNAAMGEHPVGGQLGGDYTTGQGPN